jgi:hypothetical protein
MPDEMCEIEKLKVRFENFEQDFKERCKREDDYMIEFKKNLHEVSESLHTVINTQNKQISYVAGVASAITLVVGSAWAIFSWFIHK